MDTTEIVFYSVLVLVAIFFFVAIIWGIVDIYGDSGDDDFPGWPKAIFWGVVFTSTVIGIIIYIANNFGRDGEFCAFLLCMLLIYLTRIVGVNSED